MVIIIIGFFIKKIMTIIDENIDVKIFKNLTCLKQTVLKDYKAGSFLFCTKLFQESSDKPCFVL